MITFHILFGFLLQGFAFLGAWYYCKMIRDEFSFILFLSISIPLLLLVRFLWRKSVPVKCPLENCDGAAFCEGSRPIVFRCSKCGHIVETNWYEGRRRRYY